MPDPLVSRAWTARRKEGPMAPAAKKVNIVNWFDILVKDMARAKRFNEKAFRFKLTLSEMTRELVRWPWPGSP